jgi:hypothetical protein
MSYSNIKNHFQSHPYNDNCAPNSCKEPDTGRCALKGIEDYHIVLKADDIEIINASIEKRDQYKAVDCIIFKNGYDSSERKIILIVELKAKKKFDRNEIIEKFENSGYELKKIFHECNINWEEHQINFVLLSKYEPKKIMISKKKNKKNKKGVKNNFFYFDGKKKFIITKKCDILIDGIWY